MGGDLNRYGRTKSADEFLERIAKAEGDRDAVRKINLERIAADAEATRYLAEMECPADLVEFGKRHGIENFASMSWQAGFMQGWRMAMARGKKEEDQ